MGTANLTGHPAPVSATALEQAGMDHEPAGANPRERVVAVRRSPPRTRHQPVQL
ncbi:hypothetical protein [Streptomyces prunicolor]|uniref:hypothetical protein n=1 Tax=Streptomyces prunicolor TaxID=67348 RepID=UPI003413B52E